MNVFILYRQISDQYGTDEVYGVYSSREAADVADRVECRTDRTYVKEVQLDRAVPR